MKRKNIFVGVALVLLATMFVPGTPECQITTDTPQGKPPQTVAMVDLASPSDLQGAAMALSTVGRTELARITGYQLVDRNNMDSILKEQGFQLTGACSEVSCLVKAGQVLGVRKMVGGSLSQLGRKFVIYLQLIDVETGQIERTSTEKYIGQVEELDAVMSVAIRRLVGTDVSQVQKTALFISSEPEGARVQVDGTFKGNAPLTVEVDNRPGTHRVEVTLEGHSSWQQDVSAVVGETAVINATLVRVENTSPSLAASPPSVFKASLNDIPLNQRVEYRSSGLSPDDWLTYRRNLRSPGKAVALSFVLPVLGQSYVGHTLRGILYTLLEGIAFGIGYTQCYSHPHTPVALIATCWSVAGIIHIINVIDAGRCASARNARAREEYGLTRSTAEPLEPHRSPIGGQIAPPDSTRQH